MLTAPVPSRAGAGSGGPRSGAPAAGAPARPRVGVEVRRRRTLTVAAALASALAVGASVTASGALWVATAVVVALAGVYALVVRRLRRLSVEREMAVAFARNGGVDWDGFTIDLTETEPVLRAPAAPTDGGAEPAATEPTATVAVGTREIVRFVASYMLGMAVTPLLVAFRLAGGDLSDLERHGIIERLARLQARGRSRSVELVAAGIVATAGVTSVGSLSSVASASPAVAAAATPTYTVAAGDTLGAIAAAHATTVAELAAANHIADPDVLAVGQVLVLPPAARRAPATAGRYRVRSGDTLGAIAGRFGTSVADLASANHIADPNVLAVGQVLRVPAGAGSSVVADAAAVSYRVRAGDTLGAIAAAHDTTVAALAARNHLADPGLIYPGQELVLTGTLPAPTTTAPAPTAAPAPTTATTTTAAGTPTPPAPPVGVTSAAATAVRVAEAQLGVPYVWGGASPAGFDCSGLVMYAYAAAGIDLAHYTVSQYEETTRIDAAQLEPGDLVFYDTGDGAQPGHVAMYLGDGRVVSANEPGTVVENQSIGWDGTILGYGRVG